MQDKLNQIESEALISIENADSMDIIEQLRIKYTGRKGILTEILRSLGTIPAEQRPQIGQKANQLKNQLTELLDKKSAEIYREFEEKKAQQGILDITIPGKKLPIAGIHPLTRVRYEIENIFLSMGFTVELGPEIELDYYNFEALNTPLNHPARDEQDSFYITENLLLRTHTSPVQIRVMEKQKPPIRMIAPGRCYRRDASDATHSVQFHQVEGLMVDKNINFAELKGILDIWVKAFFGPKRKTRFTPHFFPFTEPSAELHMTCLFCDGKGCRICKNSGWIELGGCGMVHPSVFKFVDYDSEIYTGFAFGFGIERMAILKYGIDDIRLFFENDLRFLEQFK